jgi:hypothetical protein
MIFIKYLFKDKLDPILNDKDVLLCDLLSFSNFEKKIKNKNLKTR